MLTSNRIVRVGMIVVLLMATPRLAPAWQFNIDGVTDEAGPCHPDGCGYQREGASSMALLPSGDVAVAGAFRQLGPVYPTSQSAHNVASAGVARVSPVGLGSEVWRHSPTVLAPQYTQADPFYPQGTCHLGNVSHLIATSSGDVIGSGTCKLFPSPASEVVVRYDGATGAVVWAYGPDFSTTPQNLVLAGTTLFLPYSSSGGRMVALDADTGSEIWTKSLVALGVTSSLGRAAATSDGDVVVLGESGGVYKAIRLDGTNGTVEWTYTLTGLGAAIDYSLLDLTVTATNDIVLVGQIAGGENGDFGVIKLSSAGVEQWRYGTRGDGATTEHTNFAHAVAVDSSGNVFAGGVLTVTGHPVSPTGNPDAAIVKLLSNGTYQWTRTFDSGGNVLEKVMESNVAVDSAGNPIALLDLYSEVSPGTQRHDPAIVKLDSADGNTLWLRRPTDTGGAPASDNDWVSVSEMRVDASDMVNAVGSIFSQRIVEYDYDAFLWRLYPNGKATPCFDGNVDPGEACDDGNTTNGDGCDNDCTVSACGNGIAAGAESCDDGNAVEGDGCDSNCTASACGNLITGGAETCDDGNLVNGDGCDNNCTVSACGNGIAGGAEACDDGNLINGDGCDNNCTVPACGNGIVAGGEACDDGNLTNGDGCESTCSILGCGNNTIGGGEVCDDGNVTSGDGCDSNCRPTGCGNGIVTIGELCDDGNVSSGDGCDANCRPTGCGNGVVAGAELCDDGNLANGDGCDDNCSPTGCGNGVRSGTEQCDDGNVIDGDGCETSCQYTIVAVAESAAPGGTVTTDTIGGATLAYPAQASVTTPTGGDVSIIKQANVSPQASGYATLGMVIQIDAPPALTAADPLKIELVLDASIVPAGAVAATVAVLKDSVPVPNCVGPIDTASPDPCVGTRQDLPGGDIRLVVLTTTASAWALAAPTHDALVRSAKPLRISLSSGSVTKDLKVKIVNGDSGANAADQTIQLTATTDCPGSQVTEPDFDGDTPGPQSSITLAPGKKGKAVVSFTVAPGGVTGINSKTPVRCGITFTGSILAPAGSVDGQPSNDFVTIDVDLYDNTDPGIATSHESAMTVLKPLKLKIADGNTVVQKSVKVSVVNGDVLPSAEAGHQITLTATDGTCPIGTITSVDADAENAGLQPDVAVAGGDKAKGEIVVAVNAAAFTTANSKAPARCVALVTATGPSGDIDTRNDTARLLIDVVDQNDY